MENSHVSTFLKIQAALRKNSDFGSGVKWSRAECPDCLLQTANPNSGEFGYESTFGRIAALDSNGFAQRLLALVDRRIIACFKLFDSIS